MACIKIPLFLTSHKEKFFVVGMIGKGGFLYKPIRKGECSSCAFFIDRKRISKEHYELMEILAKRKDSFYTIETQKTLKRYFYRYKDWHGIFFLTSPDKILSGGDWVRILC